MRQYVCLRSLIGSTASPSRKFPPKTPAVSTCSFSIYCLSDSLPLANTLLAVFQERAEKELNEPSRLPGLLVLLGHGQTPLRSEPIPPRHPLASCCYRFLMVVATPPSITLTSTLSPAFGSPTSFVSMLMRS